VPKAKRGIGGANRVAVVVPMAVVAVVAVERTTNTAHLVGASAQGSILQRKSRNVKRAS
jgi:hypothetical protein